MLDTLVRHSGTAHRDFNLIKLGRHTATERERESAEEQERAYNVDHKNEAQELQLIEMFLSG